MGSSVTQVIRITQQPYGGYLRPKTFEKIELPIKENLHENENIHASLVGLAVDYLTRYCLGYPAKYAFNIFLLGASALKQQTKAYQYLSKIKGLDNESISAACKLCGYDVVFRAGKEYYTPVSTIKPNSDTCDNIRIMVNRSLDFFKIYGPISCAEPTFEGAYTRIVSTGDGDFTTKDTLWDFKVTKKTITKNHTLQILMYFMMAIVSNKSIYRTLKRIGIYNPRQNVVYIKNISQIPYSTLETVGTQIIGYSKATVEKVFKGYYGYIDDELGSQISMQDQTESKKHSFWTFLKHLFYE